MIARKGEIPFLERVRVYFRTRSALPAELLVTKIAIQNNPWIAILGSLCSNSNAVYSKTKVFKVLVV